MYDEITSEGIGEVTIRGSVICPTKRDTDNNLNFEIGRLTSFSVEGDANSADAMREEALQALFEAGVVRRATSKEVGRKATQPPPAEKSTTPVGIVSRGKSLPNFN